MKAYKNSKSLAINILQATTIAMLSFSSGAFAENVELKDFLSKLSATENQNVPYTLSLTEGDSQIKNTPNCMMDIIIDGTRRLRPVKTVGPDHDFVLPVQSSYLGDALITVRGVTARMNREISCPINFNFQLSTIKINAWKEWEADQDAGIVACTKKYLREVGLNYPDERNKVNSPILENPTAARIIDACKEYSRARVNVDFPCKIRSDILNKTIDGTCSRKVANAKEEERAWKGSDYKIYGTEEQIISALIQRKPTYTVETETEVSAQSRLKLEAQHQATVKLEAQQKAEAQRQQTERLAAEADRAKRERQAEIAAENERRKRWEASPEGKKQLAEDERQRQQDEEARLKSEILAKERLAKEFPYYALISCGMNAGQLRHINILTCFSGTVGTEIELKNGSDYGLYKAYDIRRLGKETKEGLVINLRHTFKLRAQNASDSLILGVKIFRRDNDAKLFEKQVSQYRNINVSSE